MTDAVVVGAGPNGLVAANLLADAGWDVVVLEAQDRPGGAVQSRDDLFPGAVTDVCSAFYPLAVASRPIAALQLEAYGLRWRHAPEVLAHPLPDGRCAVLSRDLARTAASLDALSPGDGESWRRLHARWQEVADPLLDSLFTPFPPLVAGGRLALAVRRDLLRFARFAVLPVRRLLEESFGGEGGLLVAGSAMHTDLAPEASGSAFFGWLLAMLGQTYGWPVPEGGAGRLADALVRRLRARGGDVLCDRPVHQVLVRGGRAVGVRTGSGEEFGARRAVLADVPAPTLYGGLVSWDDLPGRLADDMALFQWDWGTFKVDWLLDGEIPWTAPAAGRAGTVHLAASLDELTLFSSQLAMGLVPERPFTLLGQMNVADPTRSAAGTSTVWAYTHVPLEIRGDAGAEGLTGSWDAGEVDRMADRIERQIERFAPGFRGRIRLRATQSPRDLWAHDANLVGGAINGGTSSIHQQLFFRPAPGRGRPDTPVAGLYLASSSAHPGGGVHGACGANAARVALRRHGDLHSRAERVLARATRRPDGAGATASWR